jgi:hypothetical protein
MKRTIRWSLMVALLAASSLTVPNEPLQAQSAAAQEPEAPETFVPSERLPADSAVSFPVDI